MTEERIQIPTPDGASDGVLYRDDYKESQAERAFRKLIEFFA